jgi:deoxyribodipyrimidine photolyase
MKIKFEVTYKNGKKKTIFAAEESDALRQLDSFLDKNIKEYEEKNYKEILQSVEEEKEKECQAERKGRT